jgi:hypothetical protein
MDSQYLRSTQTLGLEEVVSLQQPHLLLPAAPVEARVAGTLSCQPVHLIRVSAPVRICKHRCTHPSSEGQGEQEVDTVQPCQFGLAVRAELSVIRCLCCHLHKPVLKRARHPGQDKKESTEPAARAVPPAMVPFLRLCYVRHS